MVSKTFGRCSNHLSLVLLPAAVPSVPHRTARHRPEPTLNPGLRYRGYRAVRRSVEPPPPVRVRTAAACRLARVLVKGTIRTVMGTGTPTGSSPTSYPSLINKTVVRTGRSPTAWVRSNRRLTVFFPEGSFAVALSSALATLAARLPNG